MGRPVSNTLEQRVFSEEPSVALDAVSVQMLYAMGLGPFWQSLHDRQTLDVETIDAVLHSAPLAGLLKIATLQRRAPRLCKPPPLLRAPLEPWLEKGVATDYFSKQPFSKPTLELEGLMHLAKHPRFTELLSELQSEYPQISFYCPIESVLFEDASVWTRKRFQTMLEQLQRTEGRVTLSFSSSVALRQFLALKLDVSAEIMLVSDLSLPHMESLESISVELARIQHLCATENPIATWAFRWDATNVGSDAATAEQCLQYLRLVALGSCLCPDIPAIGVLGAERAELFPLFRAAAANFFGLGAADVFTAERSGLPEVRHLRSLVELLRQKEHSDATA